MSDIGIRLNTDKLVLTRGRDFTWSFDNLDDSRPPQPVDYPAGELYFELDTGGEHNAVQEVKVSASDGGVYRFGFGGQTTADIAFDEVVQSSHDATPDITSALEALSTIGAGNVNVSPAKLYAVWELTLTLNAGNNERQQIIFSPGAAGTYKIGYSGVSTVVLTVDTANLGATAAALQTALEGLTGIGAGNVQVTPIVNGYEVEFIGAKSNTDMNQLLASGIGVDLAFPGWFYGLGFSTVKTTTVVEGTSKFTDSMVNTLNTSINQYFNSFEASLGVDLDYMVIDNLNTKVTATSLKAYAESDLATFQTDVTSTSIMGWLNSVSTFLGIFDTIHVDFYWNRVYQVELTGALGNKPQPALEPDFSDLTGLNDEQTVGVTILQPGLERFTKWPFEIDGATATMKIESVVADEMAAQVHWQLVFLPDGEAAGGDAIARGTVAVQE